MSKLLAGPWVGEFGWELFCWQGYVRKQAKKFKHTTVICEPGHEALYEDFATEIIIHDPQCSEKNMWDCDKYEPVTWGIEYDTYLDPRQGLVHYSTNGDLPKSFKNQEFVELGGRGVGYRYVIHARSTKKLGTKYRNWTRWERLVNLLDGNVASIGSLTGSDHIKGTEDLRGLPLKDTIKTLSNSFMMLGPSSGPMHLATLCGLPQVVWGDKRNVRRYKQDWNPFNVPVNYITTWNPTVDKVYESLSNLENRL